MKWESIELQEIRIFLVLAEELHFARTAERLGLSPSRVSQSLRSLERKLGGQLVHRTSRRVALTSSGERFRADVGAAYRQLTDALERGAAEDGGVRSMLRLGVFEPCSPGPHLIEIVKAFETRHPECEVRVEEIVHGGDPLGRLRRGELDLLTIKLPPEGLGPDLVPAPILSREPRVLAVAESHPLAARRHVSIEDVAAYPVTEVAGVPAPIMATYLPHSTPSGRPIQRISDSPVTGHELAVLVARGRIVHPTVPSFADYFGQPGIVYVPITDMPPSRSALVRRRRAGDPLLREFVHAAHDVLAPPSE